MGVVSGREGGEASIFPAEILPATDWSADAGLRYETYEEEAEEREALRVLDQQVRKAEEPGEPSPTPTSPWGRGASRP